MAHTQPNTVQDAFRGRNDDGSETSATWKALVNVGWTQDTGETFRLRFQARETNGGDDTWNPGLEYQINGGGWNSVGTTTPVQHSGLATVTDGTATTQQISSGTFTGGEVDTNGSVANQTLNGSSAEWEYGLIIDGAQVSNSDAIEVRLVGLDAYNQTPSITANKVATTFQQSVVASSANSASFGPKTVSKGMSFVNSPVASVVSASLKSVAIAATTARTVTVSFLQVVGVTISSTVNHTASFGQKTVSKALSFANSVVPSVTTSKQLTQAISVATSRVVTVAGRFIAYVPGLNMGPKTRRKPFIRVSATVGRRIRFKLR